MAERLGHQQQRMELGISDRAVRASFEVSWDALDEELRKVFALLALFEGRSFRPTAVAALANIDAFDAEESLFALETLSLVRGEEERWRQHPLLADFAGQKLPDTDEFTIRFADYFYEFATEHATRFDFLEPEWANIMAAMQRAFEQARWPLVLGYADTLAQPWQTRARHSDARRGLAWAQMAATQMNDEPAVAANLLRWGEACLEQNEYTEAEALLTKGLARYMELEDDAGVTTAYYDLAMIWLETGRYPQASQALAQSLAICHITGDQSAASKVMLEQSRVHYETDEIDLADQTAHKALAMQSKLDEPLVVAQIYRHLAMIELERTDFDSAMQYAVQSKQICQELGNQGELMATLYTMTAILRFHEKYAKAQGSGEEGLALAQHFGFQRYEGMFLLLLARVNEKLGRAGEALQKARRGRTILDAIQDLRNAFFARMLLSSLTQDAAERQLVLNEAEALAAQMELPTLAGQVEAKRQELGIHAAAARPLGSPLRDGKG